MGTRVRTTLVAIATALMTSACSAIADSPTVVQNGISLATPGDLETFVQTYYRHPSPETVGELVVALHSQGLFANKAHAIPPYLGFFSEVFAANPSKVDEWLAVAGNDTAVRSVLDRALAASKAGGVISMDGHSTALNDMYWGAFFATGRVEFVNKLIDQLPFFLERKDQTLFFVGATAMWSLASVGQRDYSVRSALRLAKRDRDDRTRQLIDDVLTIEPARIKQQTKVIYSEQRASGRWR